jgi:hypothetical protein
MYPGLSRAVCPLTPKPTPADARRVAMAAKRRARPPKGSEELIFFVCNLVFDEEYKRTAEEIRDRVREEISERNLNIHFSRESVYPMVAEAIRLGYVRYCPPEEVYLAQRIADLIHVPRQYVSVVQADGAGRFEPLAAAAANLVLELVQRIAYRKRKTQGKDVAVHIGLGAGHTTLLIAKHLGRRLRSDVRLSGVEKLVLHAMNSGFSPEDPLVSAVAHFTYFADSVIPIEPVGLFSEAFVRERKFQDVKKHAGVDLSFRRAKEIELVVTSLGTPRERQGLLNQFEEQYFSPEERRRRRGRRSGDVQFRPYTDTGPIKEGPDELRAVTLFDLEDFARMTREDNKHVLLVAGPTATGGTKTDALLPLLREPKLKVWSHLCLDRVTAREVVAELSPEETPEEGPEEGE